MSYHQLLLCGPYKGPRLSSGTGLSTAAYVVHRAKLTRNIDHEACCCVEEGRWVRAHTTRQSVRVYNQAGIDSWP